MDSIWQRAKTLAEEAAKRSQNLTTSSAKITDIVSETAKLSKDFAAKKADELRTVDFKSFAAKKAEELRTVDFKSFAGQIPSISLPINLSMSSSSADSSQSSASASALAEELERFGITDDLRQFVRGFTITTFQSFQIQDDSPTSDEPTISNVRQDLTEWQQKHATLVLTTVKEISKLRYELCPRHMKDRKFWRIYFTLVSTHVAPYERKYIEEIKLKEEKVTDDKSKQAPKDGQFCKSEGKETNLKSKTSSSEQDLDSFLLGDLEDSDAGADDDDGAFVDDFDKIDNLDVEDDKN